MKTRTIQVPFAGAVHVYIDAKEGETEEQSIERAIDLAAEKCQLKTDHSDVDAFEMEFLRTMTTGNVNHFYTNEAEIISEEDNGDDE